jgi:hypothetical protein
MLRTCIKGMSLTPSLELLPSRQQAKRRNELSIDPSKLNDEELALIIKSFRQILKS